MCVLQTIEAHSCMFNKYSPLVNVFIVNVCHVYTNLTALNMFLENRCEAACACKQIF